MFTLSEFMNSGSENQFSATLRTSSVLFGLLLLVWIAGEAHFFFGQPDRDEREHLTRMALDGAVNTFREVEQELIQDTQRLKNTIQPLLQNSPDPVRIYNRIKNEKDFRGITVFRDNKQFAWAGNPVTYMPAIAAGPVYVNVQQSGYVVYFICQITFEGTDGSRYDLITTRLIRRSGASPQLLTQQYDVTRTWAKKQIFPVHYRFFDIDMGPVTARQAALSTISADSVGFVTVSTADFPALERDWEASMVWFRWMVITIALTLFFGSTIFLARKAPRRIPYLYLILTLFTGTIWVAMRSLEIPFPRLLGESTGFDLTKQLILLLDGTFLLFFAHFVRQILIKESKPGRLPSNLLYVTFASVLAAGVGCWALLRLFDVISSTQTGLLGLMVFPDTATWIIYISSLFLIGSFVGLTFASCRLAVDFSPRSKLIRFIPGFIFILLPILVLLLAESPGPAFLWVKFFGISLLLILLFSMEKLRWLSPDHLPVPRSITVLVFCVMLLSLPVYFDAEIKQENTNMERMATNYVTTDKNEAREITRSIIASLLDQGVLTEVRDVEASPSFPIQAAAQFRQQVNRQIDPDWSSYTVLAFLLDGRLNIIADYGSQPSFSDRFSTSFHDEVRSFIRQSLQRPFARLPIVDSDDRFQGFPIFIKGLQSIPSDFPTQPSWLVTFVLVEGHSFGRPVNDALAFHERDRESWNRYVITKYENGMKVSSTAALRSPMLSQQHILDPSLMPQDGKRSVIRRVRDRASYRQLVLAHDEETHVVVSVRDVTYLNYIFSGFRFFVAILLICLVTFQLIRLFKWSRNQSHVRQPQRLQDRILDSYLIATLLFMIALAFVTEYIVSMQNVRIAEQELSRNLSAVENRLRDHETGMARQLAIALEEVDVMVFEQGELTMTTAPEIFRLQLLSDYLPFEAYHQIYHENKTTVFQPYTVGGLSVLMGFRAVFENGTIDRVLGIPAYTRSAIYEEEFLQTTTYLIAFYIIIFVFFTGLAWVVSRKLTQPLSEFESGLKRISAGNLDTTIPVTSNDEIGELAKAYNQMVTDLKTVRAELAEVERDAAWSEMARQIAHEIKNPLTPMKLSIQHMQRQLSMGSRSVEELRPAIQKLTDMLVNQIESLNKIASDFSAFAKPLSGEKEQLELNALVTTTLNLFEHNEHIQFHFTACKEDAFVYGVSDELKRVLINIIKNAIEAMPGGGSIELSIRREDGNYLTEIRDSGSGIDPEIRRKIFTPNFSTKTSGTGLGLAISRKIMEAHHGMLQFDSNPGQGTVFTLIIPAGDSQPGSGKQAKKLPGSS